MHDFDYDAMQKKRIANNARRMKNGSKSKKMLSAERSHDAYRMEKEEWTRERLQT